jgi:hypothetical protein
MQQITIETLMGIWERTLDNTPPREQFELWAVDNSHQVIKEGIVATAKKNLKNLRDGGAMSQDYRLKFASDVMNVRTARNNKYAANLDLTTMRGHSE